MSLTLDDVREWCAEQRAEREEVRGSRFPRLAALSVSGKKPCTVPPKNDAAATDANSARNAERMNPGVRRRASTQTNQAHSSAST